MSRKGFQERFRNRIAGVILLAASGAAAVLLSTGCGPGEREARQAIERYAQAVQNQEMDVLFCRSAGAQETGRETFDAWVRSQYDAYLSGRDEGNVAIESGGIVLVKAFSLGKGTYYTIDQVRAEGEKILEVTMTLRFGFGAIDLSALKPGTTFYVCGAPAGKIYPVTIPRGSETVERTVLKSLRLRWTLARQGKNETCDAGWAVHSIEVVDGSEKTERLEWRF